MKVLHIQKASGIGGCERHLLVLLPALARQGLDVGMCVIGAGEFARFVKSLEGKGVETAVLNAGPDIDPLLVGRLLRKIRESQPDVVHTHLIHGDVYGQVAARIAGVPAISSVHGAHSFYRRQPYRSAAWVAGHLARRTIAISEHVGRLVREIGMTPTTRVRVVPYGIDASGWALSAKQRDEARAELGLTGGEVAIGVASRLIPHKGHDFLIDGVAEALPKAPELRLLVAGDGPLRGWLEDYAGRRLPGEVARFLGYVADVRRFMNACDLLAFPTLPELGEGFGLAALEAMAAARPVVATAVGSLPEVVIDGETGVLVFPGAVDELAGVLARLAKDATSRERMGNRGRERAQTAFTVEAMVERTLNVYQEVG